ncbi:hypothetical protein JSQ81_18410 [Sporosarcina sp. Marseille-Q4063]|nr:hypothetical protein JSQ81_18410 [Sporosarcina sp. Marseille-Q4063]
MIDGGNLDEGESVEEREAYGLTERGTIRPYNEVIGNYKKSYLESTGKMNLSPDLQRVLSDYFSSIE